MESNCFVYIPKASLPTKYPLQAPIPAAHKEPIATGRGQGKGNRYRKSEITNMANQQERMVDRTQSPMSNPDDRARTFEKQESSWRSRFKNFLTKPKSRTR